MLYGIPNGFGLRIIGEVLKNIINERQIQCETKNVQNLVIFPIEKFINRIITKYIPKNELQILGHH